MLIAGYLCVCVFNTKPLKGLKIHQIRVKLNLCSCTKSNYHDVRTSHPYVDKGYSCKKVF